MSKRIRIALLGLGRAGKFHQASLRESSHAALVSVFDLDQELAQETALAQGCRAAKSANDGVVLRLPSGLQPHPACWSGRRIAGACDKGFREGLFFGSNQCELFIEKEARLATELPVNALQLLGGVVQDAGLLRAHALGAR